MSILDAIWGPSSERLLGDTRCPEVRGGPVHKKYRIAIALGAIVALLLGVQAVVAAPPSKVAVGTAYTQAGSGSVANGNYATVVSLTAPAGKYHVSGRITVNNQTGATIAYVACNAYGNTTGGGDVSVDTGDGSNLQP